MRRPLFTSAMTRKAGETSAEASDGKRSVGRVRSASRVGLAGAVAFAAWLAGAAAALADSPAPSQAAAGDPRAGQAAGFVGDPALAILIVVLIIVASLVVTMAWVRATGRRSGTSDEGN